MAIIQRPAKQGGATTYQGKVALGYTKILASEADADHDVMYAAWNGGVDTVNIRPNAVIGEKMAASTVGARELIDDLPGTVLAMDTIGRRELNPEVEGILDAVLAGTLYSGTLTLPPRFLIRATSAYVDIVANDPASPQYDAAKPVWFVRLDYQNDVLDIWRTAAGGSSVRLGQWNASGTLFTSGVLNPLARAAVLTHSVAGGFPAGYNGTVPLNTVAVESGGTNLCPAGFNGFAFGATSMVSVTFNCAFTVPLSGYGVVLGIEFDDGTAWHTRATQWVSPGQTRANFGTMSTGIHARVNLNNGLGQTVTMMVADDSPRFTCVVHGRYV
jgi:hypothetical protein